MNVIGDVISMDLKKAGETLGSAKFGGILGLDFLARHVVHIDFDRGELLFLKSVPEGAGDRVLMHENAEGRMEVSGFLTGGELARFVIDTGLSSSLAAAA